MLFPGIIDIRTCISSVRVTNVAETKQLGCDDVRRLSVAYIDRELSVQARLAVAAHIGECLACHAHIAMEIRWKAVLRTTVKSVRAPESLVARIRFQVK
jgi:anti-sigma factor (TIGR02949 family)